MSVDHRNMEAWEAQLAALERDIPKIMSELVVGEGVYAVGQARKICKNDVPDIVNTGEYRRNFKSDPRAKRSGKTYTVRFYNNLEYAIHLEHGFRSHFVPGHWEGNIFVYNRDDPEGGMFVGPKGGFVRGHHTLRRATRKTQDTQDARLERKWNNILRQRLTGGD